MNKFIKISLITAGVLLVVGIIFGIIGAWGAKRVVKKTLVEDVKLDEKIEKIVDTVMESDFDIAGLEFSGKDIKIQVGDDAPTELKINGEIIEGKSHDQIQIDAVTVKNLELELGAGTFTVEEKEAEDQTIDILFDGYGDCNYYIEEGTLYVESFKGILLSTNGTGEVTVRIPKGSAFDEVDAKIGAGVMELENMKVHELEASIGAGELKMKNMEADELSTEIGAGSVTVKDTVIGDAEISVAMGECIFEGTIHGNLKADCDMGNLEFTLTGEEKDHNYEVKCAAGNVSIGSFEYAALAAEREVDNQAASTFDIDCSMGNIAIEFEAGKE